MVRKGWWGHVGYCLIVAGALLQFASASSPTTSLLVNGDFETGPFDTLGVVTGWTVGGPGKILSSMQGATSGTHSAALSATGDSTNNILSQSFATLPGRIYSLDFDTGVFGINFNGPMQLKAEVFGGGPTIINQTLTPPYAGTYDINRITFAHYHYVFTADSAVTTLRFTDISPSNAGADVEVDSVSVALHVTNGPATYSARDLGAAAGFGRAINIYGQIAGQAGGHAYVTAPNGGAVTDLGTLGGDTSAARSINRFGQVAGESQIANGHTHAYLSGPNGPGLTDLGSFDNGGSIDFSFGAGINDDGRVAGHSVYPSRLGRAFLSAPNGPPIADIGGLNYFDGSMSTGINNSGQVCGYGPVDGSNEHAFLSGPNGGGPLQDLGTLGGPRSHAVAVNDIGQVAGFALLNPNKGHNFLTAANGNNMTDINVFDDDALSNGINSCGQVVGRNGSEHGFIYNSTGGITDLNALISPQTGWAIAAADGINDQGQIVASGVKYATNEQHTFLLTPNLGVERADSDTVTLFWPGSCSGPAVQEATTLGPTEDWHDVTTQPTVVDGTYSFTRSISADTSPHFYRLSFVTGDQPPTAAKRSRKLHAR